jgi:hypothetical protein
MLTMESVLAFVGRNKHRPIVIGIGEQAHGEEVSWRFRVETMKRLAAAYPNRPMTVLCENIDFFVADFRRRGAAITGCQFHPYPTGCQFHPYLTPFANQTLFQKEAAIHVVDLCDRRVHGIDVQQLDFAEALPAGHEVTKRLRSTGAKETWMKASDTEQRRGHLRNKLNADIIRSFAKKGTIVLYFAQNEHISNMSEKVEGGRYNTDGWHLHRSEQIEYLSVATFCPRLWATWSNIGKQALIKETEPFKHSKKEFDVVLSTPKTRKMTFIGC